MQKKFHTTCTCRCTLQYKSMTCMLRRCTFLKTSLNIWYVKPIMVFDFNTLQTNFNELIKVVFSRFLLNHHSTKRNKTTKQNGIVSHEYCEVEHGCFTPLVFSTSGGMSKAATIVYKRLANLLSIRRNFPYPTLMGWLHWVPPQVLHNVCSWLQIPLWTPCVSCSCWPRACWVQGVSFTPYLVFLV